MFAGWTGGACIGGATLPIRVNSIQSCAAVFEPIVTATPRTVALFDYMADARGNATAAATEAFSSSNTDWTAVLSSNGRTLQFTISTLDPAGYSNLRRMSFGVPEGKVLASGISFPTAHYTYSDVTASMDVGLSCSQFTGRFMVRDLAAASNGAVQHAAVDVEAPCTDVAPGIFGTVRSNSALDARPFAGDYPRYRLV